MLALRRILLMSRLQAWTLSFHLTVIKMRWRKGRLAILWRQPIEGTSTFIPISKEYPVSLQDGGQESMKNASLNFVLPTRKITIS